MIGFVILLLWLCPAAIIIGAIEDAGGKFNDAGCLAFIPILNIFIALGLLFNGGRL